jgi:hypothetical protein
LQLLDFRVLLVAVLLAQDTEALELELSMGVVVQVQVVLQRE